jgi:hypothetical protein
MAKVQFTVTGQIIEGTATKADDLTTPTDDSTITETLRDVAVIPTATTDLLVSLGHIAAAKHLQLEISGACSIKLNSSGASAIPFTPAAGKVAVFLISAGSVTALYVTNTSGANVTIKRLAAG